MQSLLVLYALPILSWFLYLNLDYKKKKYLIDRKIFIKFLINKIDFVILPFLFFFIKFIFFKPFGFYSGYNENYALKNLIIYPAAQFLDLFRNNISIGYLFFGAFLAFLVIKYFFNFFNNYNKEFKNNFNIYIVFVGLFGSLVPYWLISHTPTFSGYSSRHQLLLLISIPFLIIFILNFFKIEKIKYILFIIFTLSFAVNFKIYSDYYIDYWRQLKTMEYITKNNEIFNKYNVIVENNTYKNPTVTYSLKEHKWKNGFLKRVLRNEKYFSIHVSQLKEYSEGELDGKFDKRNIASEHKRSNLQNYLLLTTESHGFLKFNFNISSISPNQDLMVFPMR